MHLYLNRLPANLQEITVLSVQRGIVAVGYIVTAFEACRTYSGYFGFELFEHTVLFCQI